MRESVWKSCAEAAGLRGFPPLQPQPPALHASGGQEGEQAGLAPRSPASSSPGLYYTHGPVGTDPPDLFPVSEVGRPSSSVV